MSKSKAEKSEEKPEEGGAPFDEIFRSLEERVDGLTGRLKELSAENARLKGAIVETAAQRDRIKKELEEARELAAKQGDVAAQVSRYEAEREAVRTRIESLIRTLETTEAATAPASE